jgi:hypothetical protein
VLRLSSYRKRVVFAAVSDVWMRRVSEAGGSWLSAGYTTDASVLRITFRALRERAILQAFSNSASGLGGAKERGRVSAAASSACSKPAPRDDRRAVPRGWQDGKRRRCIAARRTRHGSKRDYGRTGGERRTHATARRVPTIRVRHWVLCGLILGAIGIAVIPIVIPVASRRRYCSASRCWPRAHRPGLSPQRRILRSATRLQQTRNAQRDEQQR